MLRLTTLLFIVMLFVHVPALAQNDLNKGFDEQYKNCMGGETAAGSPQRAHYCACVRDGMKRWDVETLKNVAEEQQRAQDKLIARVEDLANKCAAEALK